MKKTFCCESMRKEIEDFKCETHKNKYECPDAVITYNLVFDEYWLIIHWDTFAFKRINYCPWCWTEHKSKRDNWIEELTKLWYTDFLFNDDIPEEYKTDEWYKWKLK